MENVSIAALIYFIATAVVTYFLLRVGNKKFLPLIQPLSKKDFALRDLFPIGFVVMDLIHYQYGAQLDRKIRRQLYELYEEDYIEYYLRVYWAISATYIVLGFFMSGLLALSMGIVGALFGIGVGLALAYMNLQGLQSKIDERHLKISIDMPDLTNKIVILSGAGMTLRATLLKISHEMSIDTPLYQDLAFIVHMMENGATDEEALGHLANRCNTPQMRRFCSVILQNIRRGGSDVVIALHDIGQEQWAERVSAARRMAAEADTKLMFPMLLMLGAVLLMTATPAVMSLEI